MQRFGICSFVILDQLGQVFDRLVKICLHLIDRCLQSGVSSRELVLQRLHILSDLSFKHLVSRLISRCEIGNSLGDGLSLTGLERLLQGCNRSVDVAASLLDQRTHLRLGQGEDRRDLVGVRAAGFAFPILSHDDEAGRQICALVGETCSIGTLDHLAFSSVRAVGLEVSGRNTSLLIRRCSPGENHLARISRIGTFQVADEGHGCGDVLDGIADEGNVLEQAVGRFGLPADELPVKAVIRPVGVQILHGAAGLGGRDLCGRHAFRA